MIAVASTMFAAVGRAPGSDSLAAPKAACSPMIANTTSSTMPRYFCRSCTRSWPRMAAIPWVSASAPSATGKPSLMPAHATSAISATAAGTLFTASQPPQ